METKICKLVMLGDFSVGKSSFFDVLINGKFEEYPTAITIGVAFHTHTLKDDQGNVLVKFNIWDTMGQERFQSLVPIFYRNAQAVIVMYDIQCQDSFICAKKWIKELKSESSRHIVIALVGNKIDMEVSRTVEFNEAKSYADENDLIFMETSAKTNVNINETLRVIAINLPVDENVRENSIRIKRTIHESN